MFWSMETRKKRRVPPPLRYPFPFLLSITSSSSSSSSSPFFSYPSSSSSSTSSSPLSPPPPSSRSTILFVQEDLVSRESVNGRAQQTLQSSPAVNGERPRTRAWWRSVSWGAWQVAEQCINAQGINWLRGGADTGWQDTVPPSPVQNYSNPRRVHFCPAVVEPPPRQPRPPPRSRHLRSVSPPSRRVRDSRRSPCSRCPRRRSRSRWCRRRRCRQRYRSRSHRRTDDRRSCRARGKTRGTC